MFPSTAANLAGAPPSSAAPMNPLPANTSQELAWAAEVLHLHGLWRLGAPKISNPNPNPAAAAAANAAVAAVTPPSRSAKKEKIQNPNHAVAVAAAAAVTPPSGSAKKEKTRNPNHAAAVTPPSGSAKKEKTQNPNHAVAAAASTPPSLPAKKEKAPKPNPPAAAAATASTPPSLPPNSDAKKEEARKPNPAAAASATPPCLSVKSNDKKEKNRLKFKRWKARKKARKLLEEQQKEPEKESLPTNPSRQPMSELAGKPPPKLRASSEAEACAAAVLVQGAAYEAANEFFAGTSPEDDSGDAVDADEGAEEEAQSKALDFLLGVFERDGDLREYYEKNREDGWFSCLVCERKKGKVHKTYNGCAQLVHHSSMITKTNRRIAHKAFGKAVCRVVGWDASRLPKIVLDQRGTLSESLSGTAAKSMVNTQEESAAAVLVQGGAYEAANEFFAGSSPEDDSGDVMDADEGVEEEAQSKALDFLLGIFERDGDLREYYEKNREDGWFSCMVCERKKGKVHKTFKGCAQLVQHSSMITKTNRRIAHKAFGKAVCRVVGWDASRLPKIVLDQRGTLSESLSGTAAKPMDNKQEESSLEIKEDAPIEMEAVLETEQENGDLSEDDCEMQDLEDPEGDGEPESADLEDS